MRRREASSRTWVVRELGWATLVVAIAAPTAGAAQSDPSAPPSTVVYTAEEFSQYAPNTALDIVNRTPGFTLEVGDDVRGFSGASSNVLIDGVRPSLKSGGIEDVLRRIPASAVERVEIMRDAGSAEAQGQTLILNVVRRQTATEGAWRVEVERNSEGLVYPRAEVSVSGSALGWRGSVKANAFWEQFPYHTRRLNLNASRGLTSSWRDNRPTTLAQAFVSGEAGRPFAGGTLNVNGRVGWERFYYNQDSLIFLGGLPDGTPDQTNWFAYDRTTLSLEIGADWTRTFGGWSGKALGLISVQDYTQSQDDLRRGAGGGLISASALNLDQAPLEVLGRATFTQVGDRALRLELGGEIAFNRLESSLELVTDTGSGPTPVTLPASDVVVSELRGEAFANVTWRLSPSLVVEGSLAYEASEISVTGDVERSQTFGFLKPAVSASWRVSPELQVRVGVRRTVGQLDFTDFAASAELQDDETVAGNPDLGPDQTWRYYASVDLRRRSFALNAEAFYERREDVLELVLLPSGGPGLANAGDADVYGLKASLAAPLDWVLAGSSLKVDATVLETEFDDPLTGEVRPLSGINNPIVRVEFRHDPAGRGWRWGVVYNLDYEWTTYLVNQVDENWASERINAYVEFDWIRGSKFRLTVRSLGVENYQRRRTFYAPDRSGVVTGYDERDSTRGAFVNLTVTGRF